MRNPEADVTAVAKIMRTLESGQVHSALVMEIVRFYFEFREDHGGISTDSPGLESQMFPQ